MRKTNQQLIESLLWIQNKQGERVRFKLNKTQEYYQQRKTKRDIILKARQKGFSSYILADQFIECLRKPTNAMVISHEKEATKRLFSKVKYYIENLAMKPAIKYETKQDIFFPKTNSNYYIGTEGQRAVGRGDTLHRVHGSEVAFWKNAKNIMAGISEAVPLEGTIILESTANGRGNWFYDEWQKAKNGGSIYTPHFIPWFIDDEYRLTKEKIISLNIPKEIMGNILNPDLIEEEKEAMKRYGLDMEQMYWRRWKKWDLGDMFFQEYPENDVDCFLQSGRPVFRIVNMTERPDLMMAYTIGKDGKKASTGKRYYGGLDGAEGIVGGDNHSFALIDPKEKPAKVVYEITSNEPIDMFCLKVAKICKEHEVILGVETHGVGVAHVQKLKELGLNFTEWETNNATRPILVSELEEAYRKDILRETYLEAKNEMLDMIFNEKNKPIHPDGKHDDRVFARGIAWQMFKQPIPGIFVI